MKPDLLPIHPAAAAFPMMSDVELDRLATDIRENGLQEPGTLWRGQLLDGRNRQDACHRAGVDFRVRDIEAEVGKQDGRGAFDPVTFVISKNVSRRHLTESQRAIVAARLANLKRGSNQHEEKVDGQICTSTSVDSAATLLSVSPRSVKSARKLLAEGTDVVVRAVESGGLSLNAAQQVVRTVPDKEQQAALLTQGSEAVKRAIRKPKADGQTTQEPSTSVDGASAAARDDKVDGSLLDAVMEVWNRANPATRKKILQTLKQMDLE